MNREAATKWVTALRSGDYEQGRGKLNRNGKLCCLGVACEVAIKDGIPVSKEDDQKGGFLYDNNDGSLPPAVQGWLKVGTPNPKLNGKWATIRNDGREETFEQIAQAIEVEAGLA